MIEPLVLLAYIPAALALNLTPGADMMFCMGQGLRGGPRAAMAANAGIACGGMVHVLVAGLGLGALMAAHPGIFEAVRWLGVAYLLWLAVKSLRASGMPEVPRVSPGRAFREGLVVNLLNPKVILFVLAFIPQFVDPARPILPQFLLFGAVLSVGGLVVNGAVGLAAGGAAGRLMRSARFATVLGRVSAGIFGALALRLALMQRS
ncbi:LysE family translocator [Pararhodobacter zhoushanensis]|uniref:LysE family translocator n=1 Tax=Pararhodobacter zhoushanensis TaxID=2479545 RepID=A0ABT3H3L1_9RHOB|nr:LysE family translocator [Pararhodobacter zhoushanensis]MCW1934367.1 LysE family translocator [Pararhodobacter zhoushanensis]